MTELEKRPTNYLTVTTELRKLLVENPDLPLLVFASDDCNNGDYTFTICGSCSARLGEFLDCMQEVRDDRCYIDREDFEEDLSEMLYDENEETAEAMSVDEWNRFVAEKVKEYDPFWKPCILLFVDN